MKIGLALSGGGMRGIAHAGVLKALEENNVNIDIYTGTSSGSHIAFLSAIGYGSKEIYDLFNKYAFELVGNSLEPIILDSILFNKEIRFEGFRSGKPIEDIYNMIAINKGISEIKDVKVPLGIVATNITDEKETIFSSVEKASTRNREYIQNVEIGKAIRASSSFSVVFNPCKIENKVYIDGGVLNNLPVDIARELGADKVISVRFSNDKIKEDSNILDIGMKTIDLMSNKISSRNIEKTDIDLLVDTDGTSLLDIENVDYCFNSGYNTAMKYMKEIKKILE